MKRTKFVASLLVTVLLTLALALPAVAQVEPPAVVEELAPGESMTLIKEVTTPTLLPTADVVISVDLTGSMGGELANLKTEIDSMITALSGASADLNVGIVSHEDYPDYYDYCGYSNYYGYGYPYYCGDEPFRVDYAVGDDFEAAADAVEAMALKCGADGPESYARVMWESGHADNLMGYRAEAQKIMVMFLDDVPHDCDLLGDGTVTTGVDPGRDATAGTGDDIDLQDDAIPSMTGAGITLLVVYSGSGYLSLWDDIAGATGGSAVQISSNGTVPGGISLTELILELIQEVRTDVWWEVVDCDPGLTVTLEPAVHYAVPGDTTVLFEETITLAEDAPQCETLTGTVIFYANEYPEEGVVIGEQEISIHVADITPPCVAYREWVNPHGNKVPPAGWTTAPGTNPNSGMNPDGFYQLGVWDNCDEDPMIFVSDLYGSVVFGPFPHGTVVKITEDPYATPQCKKMGSSRGRAGAVAHHIILPTDAVIWGVDDYGNASAVLCLVPPPPK